MDDSRHLRGLIDQWALALTEVAPPESHQAIRNEQAKAHRTIDRFVTLEARMESGLALAYANTDNRGKAMIARLCDEHIDRTGALLGRVREAARDLTLPGALRP